MPPPIIATASDASMFWLAKGLVLSVAQMRARRGVPMACFDLGLAADQVAWLTARQVRVLAAPDPLGAAAREGFQPYMLAMFVRPFLPGILEGHDGIIWLDADSWVQEADGLQGLLHVMRYGLLACCPELHASYSNAGPSAPTHAAFWNREWEAVFGRDVAERLARVPTVNSGVFAAPADHPIWAAWRAQMRLAMERPLRHLTEQCAFNKAAVGLARVERLPAHWNWMANYRKPRLHRRLNAWIEPTYPHDRIRILHLAGARLRQEFFREGMLFQRGAYLEPGEAPVFAQPDSAQPG